VAQLRSCAMQAVDAVSHAINLHNCPLQAVDRFLMDIQGKTDDSQGNPVVRWGPLLAYCYMHGCDFHCVNDGARVYVVPSVSTEMYAQIGWDVINAVRRWFPRLGLTLRMRPGAQRPAASKLF
jgi:hypothetical protein